MRTVELGVVAGIRPVLVACARMRRGVVLKKNVRDAVVADKMAEGLALEFHPYICLHCIDITMN